MKNYLIPVIVILAFSILAPSGVMAGPTHPNEVGLYADSSDFGTTGTFVIGSPVAVYLVLTRPTDVENGGVPSSYILAYELTLKFTPIPDGNLLLLDAILPPENLDIGLRKDITEGYLDYTVGLAGPSSLPVFDEAAVLVEFWFLNLNQDLTYVSLEPTTGTSIPGQMDFIGEQNSGIQVMHSVSGSHDAPVFIFNGEAVAVETESFGSVKALYR